MRSRQNHRQGSGDGGIALLGTEGGARTERSPAVVARLEAHGAELQVAATATHDVDALGADPRVGGLAAELILAALEDGLALATGVAALVARITSDTLRWCGGSLGGPRPVKRLIVGQAVSESSKLKRRQ